MREEIYEIIMSEHFPKLMTENRPQIQEVQRKSSETNVKNKNKNPTPRNIILKTIENQKWVKKKILKEVRGGIKHLPMEEQIEELHLTSPQKPHEQEKSNVKYLSYSEEKKKKTKLEFCILQNYPSNMKKK